MSFIGKAIGKLTGADEAAKGAERAANAQIATAQMGVDEQRRQFDALQALLAPFVQAGTGALGAQKNLIGLNGAGSQQTAIDALEASPEFKSMVQQGENAILQNASATGGLRGGNVQFSLSQFRPQVLAQLINEQYARLGGLTSIGQNAAAGVGNAGMQTGVNVANLLQQQGAAAAGSHLARGGVARQGFGDLLKIGGTLIGSGLMGGSF